MNNVRARGTRDANSSPTERTRVGRVRPFGMGFTLRDHTVDAAVKADGENLGAAFAVIADGPATAMCDSPAKTGDRFSFTVRVEGREALLFDHLDQLIYERDVHGVLPVAHEATVRLEGGKQVVEAFVHNVPFAGVDVRDVKAVIYSKMRLVETDAGWEAYVVFDV